MDIAFEMRPGSGFLDARVSGKFSLQEAKRTFLELLETVARHKVEKVLLDGRNIAGSPKNVERFYYGSFVADSVLKFENPDFSPATQFAYVLKDPVLDPQRLGETVAVNRGMNVQAFEDPEAALGWLGIAPANRG